MKLFVLFCLVLKFGIFYCNLYGWLLFLAGELSILCCFSIFVVTLFPCHQGYLCFRARFWPLLWLPYILFLPPFCMSMIDCCFVGELAFFDIASSPNYVPLITSSHGMLILLELLIHMDLLIQYNLILLCSAIYMNLKINLYPLCSQNHMA